MYNQNILSKLTIIIITANRHKFLKKKIKLYEKSKLKIIILDGSKKKMKNFNVSKNINYFHFPGTSYVFRFIQIKKILKSKYALIQSDDDFYLMSSIFLCLNFLVNNPSYKCAHGLFYVLSKNEKELYLRKTYIGCRTINLNKPLDRLQNLFSNYIPCFYYGVHESVNVKKNINALLKNYQNYGDDLQLYNEIHFGIVSALNGKIKLIHEPMVFRNEFVEKNILKNDNRFIAIDNYKKFKKDYFVTYFANILYEFRALNYSVKNISNVMYNYFKKNYLIKKRKKIISNNFLFKLVLYVKKMIFFIFGKKFLKQIRFNKLNLNGFKVNQTTLNFDKPLNDQQIKEILFLKKYYK